MCGGTSETVLAEEERSPGPALGDCWEGGPESQARGGGTGVRACGRSLATNLVGKNGEREGIPVTVGLPGGMYFY